MSESISIVEFLLYIMRGINIQYVEAGYWINEAKKVVKQILESKESSKDEQRICNN